MSVEEMEDSHLLNAIAHHRKQVATLKDLLDNLFTDKCSSDYHNLSNRLASIRDTVMVLSTELASRKFVYDRDNVVELGNRSAK